MLTETYEKIASNKAIAVSTKKTDLVFIDKSQASASKAFSNIKFKDNPE